jgi:hypothetical protein
VEDLLLELPRHTPKEVRGYADMRIAIHENGMPGIMRDLIIGNEVHGSMFCFDFPHTIIEGPTPRDFDADHWDEIGIAAALMFNS